MPCRPADVSVRPAAQVDLERPDAPRGRSLNACEARGAEWLARDDLKVSARDAAVRVLALWRSILRSVCVIAETGRAYFVQHLFSLRGLWI
jgi:hypothetical protein